jgi:hypothetical protein
LEGQSYAALYHGLNSVTDAIDGASIPYAYDGPVVVSVAADATPEDKTATIPADRDWTQVRFAWPGVGGGRSGWWGGWGAPFDFCLLEI